MAFSSSACFILARSPPFSSQPSMQSCLGTHSWPPDSRSLGTLSHPKSLYCRTLSKHHDPPTFDPTCICATAPANWHPLLTTSIIYPSPPLTNSDLNRTAPFLTSSEDSPLHAEDIRLPLFWPSDLPLSTRPTHARFQGPLTSYQSTQAFRLSLRPYFPQAAQERRRVRRRYEGGEQGRGNLEGTYKREGSMGGSLEGLA